MNKIKSWFFRNLAEQVLKIKPEYDIPNPKPKSSVFETQDLYFSKLEDQELKEAGIDPELSQSWKNV